MNPRVNLCEVCGKPMARTGRRHYACQERPKISRDNVAAIAAAERVTQELRRNLSTTVRHWNRSMGRQKLAEMFPDMAGRICK